MEQARSDLVFKPFGKKAHDFIRRPVEQDRKYTLLEGSVRSSKTFAIDAKLITKLCAYKVGGKRVICGATKGTVYKNILLDLFTVVGKRNYSYNSSTGELWLFGTLWFVIGAKDEASYKQILGMTIGIVICDEWTEFPRSFTMQLFLRMSTRGSRLYATTNPGTPQHYLYTEVLHSKAFAPDLEVIHFILDDNPNIEPAEKRRIVASQSGVYYQRYILGLWVAAEGAIYKDAWKDSLLYTGKTIPVSLYGQGGYVNHVIGVDYGTTNPCVFLEYIDDGKQVWEDRELYWDSVKEMRQKTDEEYADDMVRFIGDSRVMGASPKIVIDPSAASFGLALKKRGLWVVEADNDVDKGLRRVASCMNLGILRVHEENVNAVRETGVYIWDAKKVAKGEEAPLKVDDHTQDARRYALMDIVPPWRIAA
jgi:PBSX family phage terminase large subunit